MVDSPFKQRGGIMLIGPPEALKTTSITNVLNNHYDALVVSNINIQTLMKLRSDFRSGRYSTLAFTEFGALYARRADSAANLEAALHQLVEEGFTSPSFVDQRISVGKSRSLVIGAMTQSFYEFKFQGWMESGFLRRFVWCNIAVTNSYLLMDSIQRNQPLDLGKFKTQSPGNQFVPMHATEEENKALRVALKDQVGTTTPFVLMKKILSVLHWKYDSENKEKAFAIVQDFLPCLSKEGTEISLKENLNGSKTFKVHSKTITQR